MLTRMAPEVASLSDPARITIGASLSATVDPAVDDTGATTRVQEMESVNAGNEQLQALMPLTEDLARTLTCPICLDYMYKARQLQCGHLFCADCVIRMLGLPKVRCAMCKTKTSKRMVRVAPLPFAAMIRGLRILEHTLAAANSAPSSIPVTAPDDGFSRSIAEAVRRLRSDQEAFERETMVGVVRNAGCEDDGPGKICLTKKKRRQSVAKIESASQKNRQPRAERKVSNETPLAQRVCILCPVAGSTDHADDETDLGKLMRIVREDSNAVERWAHEKCAIFSEDIYEVDGEVDNVDRVLYRTSETKCSGDRCDRVKATVKCAHAECNNRYHYKCALVSGCVCIEDGYRTYCPDHKAEAPQIDDAYFLKLLSDASEPFSMRHENACYLCKTGGRLLMCDSCERVTHPACVGLRGIPLGEWHCSVCTGTHSASDVRPKLVSPNTLTQTQTCNLLQSSPGPRVTTTSGSTSSPDRPGKRDRRDNDELSMYGDVERSTEGRSSIGSAGGGKRARVSDGGKRLVLCHTGLDDAQKELLLRLAKTRRMTLKDDVEGRVTHLVVGCDMDGKPTRTMKLCKAVALKLPVVCWGWVEACAADTDGNIDLPDTEKYIHPVTRDKQKREELARLVNMGGGTVLQRDVMGKGDAPDAIYVQNEEANRRRSRDAKSRFDPPPGANVVGRTWIFDRIMQRRDQPASN